MTLPRTKNQIYDWLRSYQSKITTLWNESHDPYSYNVLSAYKKHIEDVENKDVLYALSKHMDEWILNHSELI